MNYCESCHIYIAPSHSHTGNLCADCQGEIKERNRPTDPPAATHDPVSSPSHYTRLKPEPIEVIEAWGLSFHRGQVLRYLSRAGHKDNEVQDLRKARWFLDREIERLEKRGHDAQS